MEDITVLKQNFKNILVYGCETLENENEVLFSCLAKGYRDMTSARTTFKGIGEIFEEREKSFKKDKNNVNGEKTYRESFYKELAEIITKKMLSKNFDNKDFFDKAHNETCNEIINLFHKEFSQLYVKPREFYYGSAQKLVNMTLKYFLLAAEDYKKEKENEVKTNSMYFNVLSNELFLHCPIDSIIINKMNEQREKSKGKIDSTWSTKKEDEYLTLQEEIQKYVGENESKLNYDFKVWKRKKLNW